MTDEDKAAILAEIAGMLMVDNRANLPRPNFTVHELAAKMDASDDMVLKRLRFLEKQGIIESRMALDNGHRRLVFWRKPGHDANRPDASAALA